MSAADITGGVATIVAAVTGFTSGRSAPRLFCQFCRAEVVLRHASNVPRWCDAAAGGGPHDCDEQRLWAGAVALPDEEADPAAAHADDPESPDD